MTDPKQRALNRETEDRWRRGEISFRLLDWWLRTISGV